MKTATSFSSERLLEHLNVPRRIDWAIDLKFGKQAYAFLMDAFERKVLNRWQTFNGMHALFRISDHASSSDVLSFFVEQSKSEDRLLRSEAVTLAFGFLLIENKLKRGPLPLSREQEMILRHAIARGVQPKAIRNANRFFGLGGL